VKVASVVGLAAASRWSGLSIVISLGPAVIVRRLCGAAALLRLGEHVTRFCCAEWSLSRSWFFFLFFRWRWVC